MTVDELIEKMVPHLRLSITCGELRADLLALIYTESERAAGLATENCFEFLADEILATSPGKVGA
jgi:hypothetical protein